MHTTISITLSDKQQQQFDEWISHIKALHGEYGLFTWKLTPNVIGTGIIVYSHNVGLELDLTDIENW